jgi:splicing suppressor protein 51
MRAEINAELDAKSTPEEIELDLKIKRVAEVRRAGRAAIKAWKPLPSACLGCFKIGSTADGTLMQCSRCKVIKYCSGACQKAHWPKHKESCKKYAVDTSNPDKYPFHAIYQSTYLHNRDETKTYQLLIDCLRMRQEDVYALEGDTMAGTIYSQEPSSVRALKQFLRKAKWIPRFFPPWWTEEKEKACIEYGMNDSHFSLECAQEKNDIQKTWKNPQMPMKLRLIAESVYGDTPAGSKSEHVMEMMMQTERGKFTATTLDVSAGKKKK